MKIKGEKQDTRYIHDCWIFEDFEDFLKEVTKKPTDEMREYWGSDLSSRREGGWAGTRSYAQSVKFATKGWQQGRGEFTEKLEAMAPYVMGAQRQKSESLDVAGYRPDVPAMCAGSPAYMYNEGEDLSARTPVLRMLVNIGGNAGMSEQCWQRRGAAICSVVDYFEDMGTRVEVELCWVTTEISGNKKALFEATIPVKRADEHVEPDRFAFMLGNASVLRRFCFDLIEKCPEMGKMGMKHGYGRSIDAEPDHDQIYFPAIHGGYNNNEEALQLVLKRISEFLEPEMRERISEDWEQILGESRAF